MEYDRYSWIAADSLLQKRTEVDTNEINGWVVVRDGQGARVVFGREGENGLLKAFEVHFNDSGAACREYEAPVKEDGKAFQYFEAIRKAREANRADLDSFKLAYNAYVIEIKDSLIVYLIPGSVDGYLVVCGGIKTVLDRKSGEIMSNEKLHRSPVVISIDEKTVMTHRTSSLGDVVNEVDIAQVMMFKTLPFCQAIETRKHTFVFEYDRERDEVKYRVGSK